MKIYDVKHIQYPSNLNWFMAPNNGHVFIFEKKMSHYTYLNCVNCGVKIFFYKNKFDGLCYCDENDCFINNNYGDYIWKISCNEIIIKNILE